MSKIGYETFRKINAKYQEPDRAMNELFLTRKTDYIDGKR